MDKKNSNIYKIWAWLPGSLVLLVVILSSVLKNQCKQNEIYLSCAVLCSFLGVILFLLHRNKKKSKSIGQAIITLIALKDKSLIPILFAAFVSSGWLVDFARDLQMTKTNNLSSLLGVFAFASLLWLCICVIIFIDYKNTQNKLPNTITDIPIRTKGLIISLSPLRKEIIDELNNYLDRINIPAEEARRAFNKTMELKSNGKLDGNGVDVENQIEKAIFDINLVLEECRSEFIKMLALLSKSRLYTPLLALNHHQTMIQNVWLLVSKLAEETTEKIFDKIVQFFYGDIFPKHVKIDKERIPNPNDLESITKIIDTIYVRAETHGLEENEVTSDITGGTASMSAGIILACVRTKRKVEYLRQDNFRLQKIIVTARNIPGVIEELIDQFEMIRSED